MIRRPPHRPAPPVAPSPQAPRVAPINWRETVATVAFTVLMFAVMTNLLAFHFHETKLVTIRPVAIIAALGAVVLVGAMPVAVHFPTVTLVFAGLLGMRAFDAIVLKRFADFADSARNNTGFALVFFVVAYVGIRMGFRIRPLLIGGLLVCGAVTFGSIAVDFFVPGIFPVTTGRAAGYFVNSNGASFALAVLLFSLVPLIRNNTLRVILVCLTVVGCFMTLSRGSFLALLCGILVFAQGNLRARGLIFAVGALVVTFIGLTVIADQLQPGNEELNSRARLLLGRQASAVDDSGRIGLLVEGWRVGTETPWVGRGSCYSGTPQTFSGQGPHNLMVALFMDQGLPGMMYGLVATIAIGLYCYRRCRAYLPLFVVLLVTIFFNHNLLESSVFLFAVALIFVAGEPAYFQRRKG